MALHDMTPIDLKSLKLFRSIYYFLTLYILIYMTGRIFEKRWNQYILHSLLIRYVNSIESDKAGDNSVLLAVAQNKCKKLCCHHI